MLESFILAGVPVFNLPIGKFKEYNLFDRGMDDSSPIRPPVLIIFPVYIFPFKNVPVVSIIFFAL